MSIDKQIASISKSAFYQSAQHRQYKEIYILSALLVPYSCIYFFKANYCNSVLSGLSKNQTQRLQYVQNSAARLLTGTSMHDNITPVLRQLHWLPVAERINYKTLLLTFKSPHGMTTEYL